MDARCSWVAGFDGVAGVGASEVRSGTAGGLGDTHRGDSGIRGEGGIKARGELGCDEPGHVLGGGVEIGKWRGVVEVGVVEGRDNLREDALEGVKVAEEAVLVEVFAGDGGGDPPVVPMDGLAHAAQQDGVGGAELGFDFDFEHGEG